MSKYTPGPWIARRVDSQEWHIDAPNGDPTLGHVKWSGLAVYGCDDFRQGGDIVAEANARLIAAAPRMYAVVERGAKAGDEECLAILEEINGSA